MNDVNRLPPGQRLTNKFPVLHAGSVPKINSHEWSFRTSGLVKNNVVMDIEKFKSMPRIKITCDIHCVTRWSKFDTNWEGVPVKEILLLTELEPGASHVLVHASNNFTTNLPVDLLYLDNVILADTYEDEPLSPEHGGPVRLIVPQRYFWKSAKWVTGLEFLDKNIPGFWEKHGYHMEGDPWKEERYSSPVAW